MKILNRIVTFLLAAAVFPALVLRMLVRAVVSVNPDSSVYKILSAFMKDTINRKMEITVSIKDAFEYWQNGRFSLAGMEFSIKDLPKELFVTKGWLIASGVLIAVTVLIAIIIMGCSVFAQAHKTVMGLSAGALACLFAAVKCFGKFAAPFVNGTIDIGGMLANNLISDEAGFIGSLGSAALKGAIKIDILQLSNAVFTLGIIFGIILLWTLAYYITLPEKDRKIKNK